MPKDEMPEAGISMETDHDGDSVVLAVTQQFDPSDGASVIVLEHSQVPTLIAKLQAWHASFRLTPVGV